MEMFERGSRLKLRFEMSKGALTIEDLWDLSLNTLDSMAVKVDEALSKEGGKSFIPVTAAKRTASTYNDLRLDILKHVISTKAAEEEARKARAEKSATISKLKELAQAKQDEKLASQSLEDILKQLGELEAQAV